MQKNSSHTGNAIPTLSGSNQHRCQKYQVLLRSGLIDNTMAGDEGNGHACFSTEKLRSPASRRRAPAFDSVLLYFVKMRAMRESNPRRRFWRPKLYHLTNRPSGEVYGLAGRGQSAITSWLPCASGARGTHHPNT